MTTLHPSGAATARLHPIDGLRCVAVTLVLFCHSAGGPVSDAIRARGLPYLADFVWYLSRSGVELFFVLSGTVLLRSYLRSDRPFRTTQFATRRALRIFPPYWAALLVAGLVIGLVTVTPSWYSTEQLPQFRWQDWLSAVGIFDVAGVTYNSAWWSLEVELVFYLSVPLFIRSVISRAFTRTAAYCVFAGAVAVSVYVQPLVESGRTFEPYPFSGLLPLAVKVGSYLPCFVMGVIIAKWDWSKATGWWVAGFGVVYELFALAEPRLNVTVGFALIYGGIVIVSLGKGSTATILSRWTLVWIGERSYSLFLIHFSALYLTYHVVALMVPSRTMAYFVITRLVGVPLAVLAAMALFTLVERPFARSLETGDRFWPWRPRRTTESVSSVTEQAG